MPNALIPELTGRRLTVDVALKQPNLCLLYTSDAADE